MQADPLTRRQMVAVTLSVTGHEKIAGSWTWTVSVRRMFATHMQRRVAALTIPGTCVLSGMFGRRAVAGTSRTLLFGASWRRIVCGSVAVIHTRKIPASMGTIFWSTWWRARPLTKKKHATM